MDHTGSNRLHGFAGFFKNFRSLTAIVAAFIILLCIYAPAHGAALTQEAKEKILDAFYSTRVPFLENTGQLGDWNVKYYARTLGAGFFITGDGKILYSIARNKDGEGTQVLTISEGFTGVTAFLGNGGQKSTAQAAELIGNIPSMWAGGIPSYDWLIFGDISNGISLELVAYGGGLDKFFVVKPQARTGDITIRTEGTQKLSVTVNGELAIETAAGIVIFSKPLAYQQVNGEFKYVDAAYEIFGDGYGFKVGQYDTTKDLVIVPSLFSMPNAVDGDLPAVEVDNSGSVYIAGSTASLNFTGTGYEGSTDAFITKLDNTLTSLMALGGTGMDQANAVATDGKGSVYVAGTTMSPDFPVAGDVYNTTYGGNGDIFISKLDADLLSVVSSSLLGGSGEDRATSIAIDRNGNISIGGLTTSKSFLSPTGTVSGSPNGSLTSFSTTLGANLNSYLSSQSANTTQKTSGTSSVQTKEETDLTKQADSPVQEGKIAGPGWRMAIAQPVGIQEARAYYNAKRAAIAAKKASAPLRLMSSGAEDNTPEIQALARALHYDPKLIYDYVHNNIDYVPYFGSLKGATLTYLDGSGNDCDQASLMIALLRASGYTAWYVYGAAWMWGADLSNWLGVDSTDSAVGNTLALGGIPLDQPFWDGSTWLGRVWVKATINGTTYAFDPALKSYTYVSKIDIGQAMGYSRSTVMTGATSGATVTSDYAQNMNETNIRNQLTAYATNLVTTIRSQYPNKEVNEIIGGRNIVRTNLTAYQTEPSFFMYYEIESWQDTVPEEYTTTITVEHWNQDNTAMDFSHTFKASELGGSRITLTYSQAGSNYYAELRQDGGSPLASSARATTLDAVNHLHISIDHPYAYDQGNYADDYNIDWTVKGGRSYAIAYNFGGVSNKLLQKRQQQLEIYRAQGLSDTSEPVRGETLNIMGQTWLKETAMVRNMLSALSDVVAVTHHAVGVMAQEQGYYIDVKAQRTSYSSKHSFTEDSIAHFKNHGLVLSALEHGIIAQMMGSTAASTMSLFQVANATGRKVFYATSSNYSTVVRPQLENYTTAELDDFQAQVNAGKILILPDNGQLVLNQWRGKGYISKYFSASEGYMGMIIGGNYYGGYSSIMGYVDPLVVANISLLNFISIPNPDTIGRQLTLVTPSQSNEPVDMASGAYLYDRTDLALGGGAPLGLAFARSYNSNLNLSKRSLGYGWTHNYDIYVNPTSHGEPVLGGRQPVDAAGMIAALYTCLDILKNLDTIEAWMTASLASKWAIDQVIDNAVTVNIGSKVLEYIKLPDGTYAPPPGITTNLVKNGNGTYSLLERMGTQVNFNSDNKVSQIVDIDGNTITFTYTGTSPDTVLSTVTDAFSRTLTFSSSSGRISSVIDPSSPARSVSYGYDANNNLTSYTDPEGKAWSYLYADPTNHRMTGLRNPLNVTMATNAYDALGKVATQTVPRQSGTNAVYNFYFSGFINSEEDPDGNMTTYYYDQKGREYARKDALGNLISKVFDGQDHTVSITDPRVHTTSYLYDGNHNLTRITDALSYQTNNTYESSAPYRLTDTTDPLSHTTSFTYNSHNHLLSTSVYPSQGVTITNSATYYANGFRNTATDGRSITSTFTYDAYGNPATTYTASHPAITYTYDTIGRMTELKNQLDWPTSFTYDKRGLLLSITDPLSKQTTFTYDNAGRLTAKTDRRNHTISYAYTPTDKIGTVTYPDSSTVSFTYNQLDQVASMTDLIGSTGYSYDAAGRLTSMTDPHSFVIGYTYDEAGNLTELTYPGNKTVYYAYDALNRLSTVTIGWITPNPTVTYSYDETGRMTGFTHFNGSTVTYTYDNANRLTSLVNRKSDQAVIASYSFTLDGAGNRTGITQTEPDQTLPGMGSSVSTYNLQKNRLLSSGGDSFTYDDEGQIATGYGSAYTFDYEHRLTAIGSSSFSYDARGNRLEAIRSGVVTRYIYDAQGNLMAEADGNNEITRYYIHGAGLLAMVTPTDQVYSYHFNGTGSTIAMTDAAQSVINQYRYDPFGNIISQSETIPQPFTFVGQYGVMTEPNGFYYMRARYYDPRVGRFISEDPIGFDGGDVNLYGYAGNNPIMGVDPWGRCQQSSWLNTSINMANVYIKIENFLSPYIVGATMVGAGGVVTVVGGVTAIVGLANIPETGPAGALMGIAGLKVAVVGAGTVALGLDVYADTLRTQFNLPKWFDLIPNIQLMRKK